MTAGGKFVTFGFVREREIDEPQAWPASGRVGGESFIGGCRIRPQCKGPWQCLLGAAIFWDAGLWTIRRYAKSAFLTRSDFQPCFQDVQSSLRECHESSPACVSMVHLLLSFDSIGPWCPQPVGLALDSDLWVLVSIQVDWLVWNQVSDVVLLVTLLVRAVRQSSDDPSARLFGRCHVSSSAHRRQFLTSSL